jgi:hypothetical protein
MTRLIISLAVILMLSGCALLADPFDGVCHCSSDCSQPCEREKMKGACCCES